MSNVAFGTNTNAVRKRVRFYNRESSAETIEEGQPLCYIFDSTTNELGYDVIDDEETSTTDEGHQNEGKFLQVEKVNDDNLLHFAGVVASGSWCGKSVAATSWEFVDVYVPNGAVVPARCDVDTTAGQTILALEHDSKALTQPLSATQGRPVAIAMETETDLDSTADITLVKLDPDLFLYQDLTGTALNVGVGTSDIVVNRINVSSAQTGGRFTALEVKSSATAGAHTTSGGCAYGQAAYFEANLSGTISNHFAGVGIWLNHTGGTPAEYVTVLEIGLYEDGANLSSVNQYSLLTLSAQVADAPTANTYGWFKLANNGAEDLDQFILATNLTTLPAVVMTTADRAIGTNSGDYAIKVYLANQAGTQQWYIPLMSSL